MAAHKDLAVRDFPWLLPEVSAQEQPDPRNGFYETLGAEFGRAKAEAADQAGTEAPAPLRPGTAGDGLPY